MPSICGTGDLPLVPHRDKFPDLPSRPEPLITKINPMNSKNHRKIPTAFLSLSFLAASCLTSSAVTVFGGGEIRTAGDWDLGLPTATEPGTISVDGTVGGNLNASGSTNFENATVTQDAGTITGTFNMNAAGLVWNLTGGTMNGATGNFNANSGSIFNLSGGEVIFGADLIVNSSTGGFNVGGTVVISTATDFDLRLNQDNAFFSIASDWTGSLVSGSDATVADWIDQLVYGAGPAGKGTFGVVNSLRQIDVGGTKINNTNFSSFFQVTPDGVGGSSLSLIPEPSSLALFALGGLVFARRRR